MTGAPMCWRCRRTSASPPGPCTTAGGLISPAQQIIEGLPSFSCGAAYSNGEPEAALGGLEHHAFDGLPEALSDRVCILLNR